MIGKITSEMISRRWALSLLGALGFVAAPTVLRVCPETLSWIA
jgi:hypothetical protein